MGRIVLARAAHIILDERNRTASWALQQSPHHRVVILGGPGTGKTTTLKYLVGCQAREALADPQLLIPLFISLPDFDRLHLATSKRLIVSKLAARTDG